MGGFIISLFYLSQHVYIFWSILLRKISKEPLFNRAYRALRNSALVFLVLHRISSYIEFVINLLGVFSNKFAALVTKNKRILVKTFFLKKDSKALAHVRFDLLVRGVNQSFLLNKSILRNMYLCFLLCLAIF